MKFNDMNLKQSTKKALTDMFGPSAAPTEIQKQSIPFALEGKNVIAQARTGSGKTLAFSIPIIEGLEFLDAPEALILVPTRELCKQVEEEIEKLGKYTKGAKTVQVYGGVSINPQIKSLIDGANIIVATPGRLIDLYERQVAKFDKLKFVVLDEADRMLDMGFIPDIQYIMSKITVKPQLLLFSATILDEIKNLSNQFTGGKYIDIDVSKDVLTVGSTQQFYYLIPEFRDKIYNFVRIIRAEKPEHTLIFTNTKKTADWLLSRLENERGLNFKIGLLSGNMSQNMREKVTNEFKNKKINLLIATDVAARGLDIPDVTHVFNYDIPQYEETYVHRIGRTSRMGKKGIAITMCLQDEFVYLCRIEGFTGKSITKKELPPRGTSRKRSTGNRNTRSNRDGNRSYGDNRGRNNSSGGSRTRRRTYGETHGSSNDNSKGGENQHRERSPFF